MMVVDERRLDFGGANDLTDASSPATFLEALVDVRVASEGERRAIVRRIAVTRSDLGVPEHVRSSASFARVMLAAIDRGADEPFPALIGEYRTLTAFANLVDVNAGLQRALAAGDDPWALGPLAVDSALLASDGTAFAWRRFAARAGAAFTTLDLPPIAPPALDLAGVASITAFLRFAASSADADARDALRSKLAPIEPDDAALLLTVAGDRANVLDVIDAGASAGGREFAHALRSIARAYRVPDADARAVVTTCAGLLGLDEAAARALDRIARDFDAARALAPAWDAGQLIGDIEAELAGCSQSMPALAADPAGALVPETSRPVTARRATFSASSLNAFAECERKWYYRYVCSAVEDRGSSASFYGIAFHAALEEFHGTHTRFDRDDRAALASALDYCVATSFDRHRTRFDAAVEFELQKRRARRTAKRYLSWLIERARRTPFEVVGCETSTEVDLDGYAFVGFIDRLDRDDATGEITVVDYKTGAIATSAQEYLADVTAFREFQLPFYYWARTAAGDRVTRLSLVPLKDALLDVEPVELTVVANRPRSSGRDGTSGSIGVADLERARERMVTIAAKLATPTIAHYAVTDDPDACRYCSYKDACRERPAVAEERFGR